MDLPKLLDLLHQYPSWFRALLVLWILGGAFLIAGLVLLKTDERHTVAVPQSAPSIGPAEGMVKPSPASIAIATPPTQVTTHWASSKTAEEYATGLRALSDRFLEKQEFIERHQNTMVSWEGRVERVSEHAGSGSLSLVFKAGVDESRISVYVALPEEMRTKAFSLQRGDLVRVTGRLSLSTPSMPDVDATELSVVRPRGGG